LVFLAYLTLVMILIDEKSGRGAQENAELSNTRVLDGELELLNNS